MGVEKEKEARLFSGNQMRWKHRSAANDCEMRFSVYLPPQAQQEKVPGLFFLSGLTCTDENFSSKSGAQRYASEHGVALVIPDTSPRGVSVVGQDEDWDFGSGAGFYVNATEPPYRSHYRMYDYVCDELPDLITELFPIDRLRLGVFGHSMGGHGALVVGLRNPELFKSVSAFAPICSPRRCPWGEKALGGYLGNQRDAWSPYDATELIRKVRSRRPLLVDQGTEDEFVSEQLKPELLREACDEVGTPLELRMQEGYDHSYNFISTFVGDHIAWHMNRLAR